MAIMTTMIIDHIEGGQKAVGFTKRYDELSHSFCEILKEQNVTMIHKNKTLHVWSLPNAMIFVEGWDQREKGKIKVAVLFFRSEIENGLYDMGISVVNDKAIEISQLKDDLVDTYQSLGISDWIREGMPAGVRNIVAYRHGYRMTNEYNNMLTEAMALADASLANNY